MNDCAICTLIKRLELEGDSGLVHEFSNSWLILGNHQYYPGYCLLIYKHHVRELHELEPDQYKLLSQELLIATQAIVQAHHPWKINHACLGNQDQHIHWHIIPRYESEADHTKHPWLHADSFDAYIASDEVRRMIAAGIRKWITTSQ